MNISESTKNKILKIYYDPVTGYHKNINKYYDLLNEEIPKDQIKFIINNIYTNQIISYQKIDHKILFLFQIFQVVIRLI